MNTEAIKDEEEFFTPANEEAINFRLDLIKNYPNYIKNRKSVPSIISDEYKNYNLQRISNFTTNGNIAKIINYKDNKKLLSTHKGDISEFNLNINPDTCTTVYNHHNSRVSALEYDVLNDTIISGAQDGTLIVNKNNEMPIHDDRIINIQRLNFSHHLISISQDATWSLINYKSCQKLYQQEGYSSPVTALTVSLYDNLLVTADSNEFQLHDLRSGNLISRRTKSSNDPCHSMKLFSDNKQLVVSGRGNLKLFDLRFFDKNPASVSEILLHSGNIITSMDCKDNIIVTTGFNDGSVVFTGLQNGELIPTINESSDQKEIVVSDDKLLCCKFNNDGSVYTGGFSSKVGVIYK
ncbi:hypothetical protein ACO0SA_004650 [Hanseniaspora valbyensis]